jgi:hypothetical protein
VRDQVSHPYKTTGRIMVLYILTFTFLYIYIYVCVCVCVNVCMLVQKRWPTSRWGRKLKFGRHTEEQPKQKRKIRNPEKVCPEGPKCGLENAMFFNILEPMARRET